MSHKDLRDGHMPTPKRVQDVKSEVKAEKYPKEWSSPSSSVVQRSIDRPSSKIKINILRYSDDHPQSAKRCRLIADPWEPGTSYGDRPSDWNTVKIKTEDFEMEEEISAFKLNNLPNPVPLETKSSSSEKKSNAKGESDKKPPRDLPITIWGKKWRVNKTLFNLASKLVFPLFT